MSSDRRHIPWVARKPRDALVLVLPSGSPKTLTPAATSPDPVDLGLGTPSFVQRLRRPGRVADAGTGGASYTGEGQTSRGRRCLLVCDWRLGSFRRSFGPVSRPLRTLFRRSPSTPTEPLFIPLHWSRVLSSLVHKSCRRKQEEKSRQRRQVLVEEGRWTPGPGHLRPTGPGG